MMNARQVYMIGAGGHSKSTIDMLQGAHVHILGIFDDNPSRQGKDVLGIPVLGTLRDFEKKIPCQAVIAIGDNETRKMITQRFQGVKWPTVIHPKTSVHPTLQVGEGTLIFEDTIVHPDVIIGSHCIIQAKGGIGHDTIFSDFVHTAPGVFVSGGSMIYEGVFMGIRSVTIPTVNVGPWSTVGAGSVVMRDVPPDSLAVGVPAKIMRVSKEQCKDLGSRLTEKINSNG
jgi:acetyltransferase EpsM